MAHKHFCSAVAVAAVLVAGTAEQAGAQQFYAGGALGTATFFDQNNIEYDYLGYVIAGQFGYRMTPDIRLEAEVAYEKTEGEIDIGIFEFDVDLDLLRVAGTAYYDFNGISMGGLVPFAGAGLGIVDGDANRGGVGGTELSAHLDGGASLNLGNNLDFVPMARWELTDDASNFQLRAGARFWF